MPTLFSLLSLPSTLLLLTVSPSLAAAENPWPHNLPKHMKYFPEDEAHVKRGLRIQERLAWETPVGVKKMSTDEGEMFMFDNWIFEGDQEPKATILGRAGPEDAPHHEQPDEVGEEYANSSAIIQPFSPLRPHSEQTGLRDSYARFAIRSLLMNRGFQCPEGTNNCSSIGQPNSCCSTGSYCITIPDNGYGPVGCCPQGQTCAGAISCDTAQGYTSCPNSPNGGCCLPGYSCLDVGCIAVATSTAIVLPPSSTPVTSQSPVISQSSSSAVISSSPSTTSTAIVVVPVPTSPASSSTYTCSTGWFSCAASLGGGCCRSGRQCGSGIICSGTDTEMRTSSSIVPSAPVRPTSNSGSDVTTTTTITGPSVCPTGFYVCSAYYPSGCCRVGMDCHTTGSCIQTASVSVVVSDGVTIVAPTGASFATTAKGQAGSCPSGWYSCAASLGGNCCLNGYSCGAQCTATGTAAGQSQVVGKVAPSSASVIDTIWIWTLSLGAISVGVVMVLL